MTTDSDFNLIDKVKAAWPLERWAQFNVLVAVSGGADSVALLKALYEIKRMDGSDSSGRLIVANFNHRLRGAESDGDYEFVSQLAGELGTEFHGGTAQSCDESDSENALRDQRYEFLLGVARKTNCRYIVTAHHRDDQVETVLFRLFRGTGVGGLGGIPQARVVDESLTIMRPMLNVSKKEIESSLKLWKQPWRVDATNAASDYTRNFIRNDVLPKVRERFAAADESIARLARQAFEYHRYLRDKAASLCCVTVDDDGVLAIECEKVRHESSVLVREMFMEVFRFSGWPVAQLGFRELDRLSQLLQSDESEPMFQLPGGINCWKSNDCIYFANGNTGSPK